MISTYLVPLHRKYCLSETSTLTTRLLFYATITTVSTFLIYPLPYFLLPWLPLSKPLWTPPFLLQTTGITLLSWTMASLYDFPSLPYIPGLPTLETMGRKSLEIYLAAEILQEFLMYPGKRKGGGMWEGVVRGLQGMGLGREWACFWVSFGWAVGFGWVGWGLEYLGWKIKL